MTCPPHTYDYYSINQKGKIVKDGKSDFFEEAEKVSIGENIKRLRENRNLTQIQLGEMINVTQSMIAQLERGTRTLTIPFGMDIAKVLGCKFDELIAE